MGTKGNVSESVWGHLRRLAIQKDRSAGRFNADGERSDFLLDGSELQMDLRTHPFMNLDVLFERLVIFQRRGKLMRTERNMGKTIWGYLGRLSVQQKGGAGRLR